MKRSYISTYISHINGRLYSRISRLNMSTIESKLTDFNARNSILCHDYLSSIKGNNLKYGISASYITFKKGKRGKI